MEQAKENRLRQELAKMESVRRALVAAAAQHVASRWMERARRATTEERPGRTAELGPDFGPVREELEALAEAAPQLTAAALSGPGTWWHLSGAAALVEETSRAPRTRYSLPRDPEHPRRLPPVLRKPLEELLGKMDDLLDQHGYGRGEPGKDAGDPRQLTDLSDEYATLLGTAAGFVEEIREIRARRLSEEARRLWVPGART